MAVVTVSRHYYSSGDEIVRRVCALLQYRYFDKDLIAEIAAETGVAAGRPVDFSEDQYRMPSFLDRLLNRIPQQPIAIESASSQKPGAARTREKAALDAETAITLAQAAIKAAYDHGHVVIVGRGGQAILRGKPGAFHVRIQAPLEWRIERLRAVEEYTYIAAKEVILEHDQAAADYVKRFYGVNWADPTLYHLVINCDLWGVTPAAQLIVTALKCLQSGCEPQEGDGVIL
ncbi:MAG: AAA family ATPase [Nitrososphaerales archaeon]